MNKKVFFTMAAISLAVMVLLFSKHVAPTKIATLNFPDFTVEKFIRSNDNPFVKITSIDLNEAEKSLKYDFIIVRVHGSSLNKSHLDIIKEAIEKGIPVFSTESDNDEINSIRGRELEYLSTLMDNGSSRNYASFFNYIRKNIDKKKLFNGAYKEPVIIPSDYFFRVEDDLFFADYEEYQRYYEASGKYKADAPRIVFLSGNINIQNSNEEHIASIINTLEDKGLNVYPIHSFGPKKLQMIKSISPDIIINNPHGRLVMGGGESGVELLQELNVPILSPITVSELYDNWLKSRQGMESGGMTSMSVVLPELDGAILPFAVAAQFERNGMKIFDAIPKHTDKFCDIVENFTKLQTTDNSEKKVAIYYYKGTGKGTLSASQLEGVQSLYNTLKMLEDNGYNVDGLPDNIDDFEEQIQKEGSVLGTYALGSYDEYIKNGNPELIDADTFKGWLANTLPIELIDQMREKYGEVHRQYMSVEKDGKKHIAVSRIQYGNIAILPQPLPSIGEDIEVIIHGVDGAVAYPYVASYFWTRYGFDADALIHFGTHGSLEFIPGKQIALSDYDWTDALLGDLPHFYIYTINNIGEGIIAKRRSYATLVSHLTAPFMQSELYDELRALKDKIHRYEHLEDGDIKENYRLTISEMAMQQNIQSALGIDTLSILSDEDIDKIHIYLEEIEGEKVTDGLYTLGKKYNKEELDNTTRLISIDPIRYSLAQLDVLHDKITDKQMDNISFISHKYNATTERIIKSVLSGECPQTIFESLISKSDLDLYNSAMARQKIEQQKRSEMMAMMMQEETKKPDRFLDDDGFIIEKVQEENKQSDNSMPSKNTSMMESLATTESLDKSKSNIQKDNEIVAAVAALKLSIESIVEIRENLAMSTEIEQKSLINALNGGYTSPSSAGDVIVNPRAIPTGKNFYSINPEITPTEEAWKTGKKLANNLIEAELKKNGTYPQKVSFTLWSSDFISSEGATIAQILYLLGVEPLRDGFGYIRSLRVIPEEDLSHPRIDVVVQTSGQLRDIAASRLALINKAIEMAAEAPSKGVNYVKKGFDDAEKALLEKGFSPVEARKYSRQRIFGGINGNYGTGIMSMVEKGDSWEEQSEIAKRYIENMSGIYTDNGGENWGEVKQGVFEAALLNTSVVVQPRSSNTWGALSLDHVYEFMGGLSAAVQEVTGNDPTAYFNDFRNTSNSRVQELKEAIGVETNSTIFNPKFINEKLKGEASSYNYFAEVFNNTYGWNAMKPSAIDQHIWNEYYEIYVKDKHDLDIEEKFSDKNPYSMQTMTAVMLESARKGLWKASEQQIKDVARLHAEFVDKHGAACNGFVCDNAKLRDFISLNINEEQNRDYNKQIDAARQVQISKQSSEKSIVLEKEETDNSKKQVVTDHEKDNKYNFFIILGALLVSIIIVVVYRIKK